MNVNIDFAFLCFFHFAFVYIVSYSVLFCSVSCCFFFVLYFISFSCVCIFSFSFFVDWLSFLLCSLNKFVFSLFFFYFSCRFCWTFLKCVLLCDHRLFCAAVVVAVTSTISQLIKATYRQIIIELIRSALCSYHHHVYIALQIKCP